MNRSNSLQYRQFKQSNLIGREGGQAQRAKRGERAPAQSYASWREKALALINANGNSKLVVVTTEITPKGVTLSVTLNPGHFMRGRAQFASLAELDHLPDL